MECQYCKKILKNKITLNRHQKTTKYCLKIQNKKECNNFLCKICNKSFGIKSSMNRHIKNCNKNSYIKNLEKELLEKDKLLKKYEIQIRDLQDKLENVAIKAVSRPITTNNNRSIQINNIIQNLQPIKNDELERCGEQLTLDHHMEGAEGYARFALDVPFKEKLACLDVNRRKFKYKNNEGDVIDDEGLHKMFEKFCKAVLDKSNDLSHANYDRLAEEFGKKFVDDNCDTSEYTRALEEYSRTNENAFCKKIINIISKNTKI